jgi:uncharacterized membrane protein YdbT with pleckstrin-like domain
MRYIRSHLLQNETLVYAVRPHWVVFSSGVWALLLACYVWWFAPLALLNWSFFANYSLRDLAAFIAFVAGACWLIRAYVYYMTSEYGVTNKRVLIKTGWIQRRSLEIMLDKVEGVLVDQTITGRIFNYGEITIIGTGGTKDSFPFIPGPMHFRQVVQQQVDDFEEQFRRS